jgi:hypothetical protein
MSPEAFTKLFGPEAQMEQQAHFAVQMVSALPGLIAAGDLNPFAQVACLESFFVNVRLMADFLVRTTDKRDFGAATLVPDWVPTPTDAANRLRAKWWPLASPLVAHSAWSGFRAIRRSPSTTWARRRTWKRCETTCFRCGKPGGSGGSP